MRPRRSGCDADIRHDEEERYKRVFSVLWLPPNDPKAVRARRSKTALAKLLHVSELRKLVMREGFCGEERTMEELITLVVFGFFVSFASFFKPAPTPPAAAARTDGASESSINEHTGELRKNAQGDEELSH
jgi:hypothetical protein